MKGPTVSVVIPTYNRARLVSRAVDSVVGQTLSDWELIVVDDGSSDETPAVAEGYRKSLAERFVYLRQANAGPSAARNRGIEVAKGRFVAFLDSDDEFVSSKLERQLALVDRRPEIGFVYSDYCCVDPAGRGYASAFAEKMPLARSVPCEPVAAGLYTCAGSLFDSLIEGYFIATITGLVRREVLGRGIRFHTGIRYGEEWLFFLHVARACRAGFVDEPLSVHHAVAGSLARTDRTRNAIGYAKLLRTIVSEFGSLSRVQRRSLARRLAFAYRQVGYDALREGRLADARLAIARSIRHRPSLRAIAELCSVMMHPAGTDSRPDPEPQASSAALPVAR